MALCYKRNLDMSEMRYLPGVQSIVANHERVVAFNQLLSYGGYGVSAVLTY